MALFIVLRPPCLVEDEGRTQTIGAYETREAAEKVVSDWTSGGYFRKNNFKIVEVTDERMD